MSEPVFPFQNIAYLETGNERQRLAFRALQKLGLPECLQSFDPILVGTIPIGIDIDGSDLDIICRMRDKSVFKETQQRLFGAGHGYRLHETVIGGKETVLCSFTAHGFPFEIFGQDVPTARQAGYRHMLIEHRLLQSRGEAFGQQVIALKKSGLKTEPAFAQLLGLTGDPYEALLALEAQHPENKI